MVNFWKNKSAKTKNCYLYTYLYIIYWSKLNCTKKTKRATEKFKTLKCTHFRYRCWWFFWLRWQWLPAIHRRLGHTAEDENNPSSPAKKRYENLQYVHTQHVPARTRCDKGEWARAENWQYKLVRTWHREKNEERRYSFALWADETVQ